jgi:hypothetical protein
MTIMQQDCVKRRVSQSDRVGNADSILVCCSFFPFLRHFNGFSFSFSSVICFIYFSDIMFLSLFFFLRCFLHEF